MNMKLLGCLLCMCAVVAARGQSVSWNPSSGSLGRGAASRLELKFDQCEPRGPLKLPAVDGLEFGNPGHNQNMTWNNGVVSRSIGKVFPVRALREGEIVIPSFEVETDRGRIRVPEARFNGTAAQVGGGSEARKLSDVAISQLRMDPAEVWEGQVVPIQYTLAVSPRLEAQVGGAPEWNPGKVAFDPFGTPKQREARVGGESWPALAYETRGMALGTGELSLPPVSQRVDFVQQGGRSVFDVFGLGGRPAERHTVQSEPPALKVKPLPPAPPDYYKAVGQFKIESKVVPRKVKVGEPITWTLTLSGTGNWPVGLALPPREVSSDFRAVQPKAQRTLEEGTQFSGKLSEDVVLIPQKPGTYTLGRVRYAYFDPVAGKYETITTDEVTVEVEGAPVAVAPSVPAVPAQPPASGMAAGAPRPAEPAPRPLPRDPLLVPGTGAVPLGDAWAGLLGIPVAAVLMGWFLLAARHAPLTDPARPRREARQAALAALDALRGDAGAEGCDVGRHVHDWQRATMRLLGVDAAMPSERDVRPAVEGRPAEEVRRWESAWRESERLLYAPGPGDPSRWADEAGALVRAVHVRPVRWWDAFRVRNLWPTWCVAMVLLLGCVNGSRAATNGAAFPDAYARGDFKGAQTAAEKDLSPLNWAERYNLGLALAQQGRWDRAAGHWAAAFVQAPGHPDVRWNAWVGVDRAGFRDPTLPRLIIGADGAARTARWLSPAGWQGVLAAGSIIVAVSLLAWIARQYREPHAGWVGALILAGLVTGATLSACAWSSLTRYGALRHPDAAIVPGKVTLRSVPTDADVPQQTRELAPGSVGRVEKTFLGWVRLRLAGGETGWVRRGDVVGVYSSW
jgi:hypothetical protein